MRIITDPIVDSMMFIVAHFVVPQTLKISKSAAESTLHFGLLVVEKLLGPTSATWLLGNLTWAVSPTTKPILFL